MMNKFFRMMALCALAGVPLLYTGCTDYSEDIDAVNSRIDALESGRIADVETQIGNLKTTLASLEEAKKTTEAAINDLKGQLATLDGRVDDLDDKVDGLDGTVKSLQSKVSTLEGSLKTIEDQIETINGQISSLESSVEANGNGIKANADAIKEHADSIKSILTQIGALSGRLGTVEDDLDLLKGKYDSDLKISEVIKKIEDAQAAADTAEVHATKALGEIKSLKTALGVYAEAGKLQEALDAKLDTAAFNGKFDEQLVLALSEDGKITAAIDAAITAATDEIYAVIKEFKTTFNQELRSLVFIPELYVDGIEATEYTYMQYQAMTTNPSAKTSGQDQNGTSYNITDNAKAGFRTSGSILYVNPDYAIQYHMNPSGAKVTENDKLYFISRDVEAITKTSASEPKAEFVSTEDGILTVNMKALGQKVKGEGYASIFALSAEVKRQDGKKDTTITSDYANLYASTLKLNAIAYTAEELIDAGTQCANGYHLYTTAAEALEADAAVQVAYDNTLNIKNLVVTHIDIESESSRYTDCGVYESLYPDNDYKLSYTFELVNYLSGANRTSDSEHALLNANTGVLTPCGVTGGKADSSLTGDKANTAIGRNPLVLVKVLDESGRTVLVGYIKVEIVREEGYKVADPFIWSGIKFSCNNATGKTTWDEMVDNILKKTLLSKEEFERQYELETDNGSAVQYVKVGNDFVKAGSAAIFGTVTESTDPTGTTTNVLEWTLTPAEQSAAYKSSNHTKTIYVRYKYANSPATSQYEGIYVPLTFTVEKPSSTVGVKLSEYWFDNLSKAIINVQRPVKGGATTPWKTDLDNVWRENEPVLTAAVDDGFGTYGNYKYYFAPDQMSPVTIDGVIYRFSTATSDAAYTGSLTQVVDKYDAAIRNSVKNSQISGYELSMALYVTKGIYLADVLMCNGEKLATIDPATGEITYEENAVSKVLLNNWPSQPRESAELFANIGVVFYSDCNVALSVGNEINPYHFLRPINVQSTGDQSFTDGADSHKDESNINVFDLLDFSDWRGEKFLKADTDYTNLWYFAYYQVNSIEVDIDNVTTNMDGGVLGTTLLSERTSNIELKYNTGSFLNPSEVTGNVNTFTWSTAADPSLWNDANHYNGVVSRFGFISYSNNQSTVDKAFTLRIPVTIGYAWGELTTEVDIVVNPTMGN